MTDDKVSQLAALDRMIIKLDSLKSYLSRARRAVKCSDPEVAKFLLEACGYRIDEIYQAIMREFEFIELDYDVFE